MRSRSKCPDSALARTAGADEDIQMSRNSLPTLYATSCELQTRHLQRRCGPSRRHSRLIAALHFGEGGL